MGLAASRTQAQALIRTGRVLVDDIPVEKPGTRVREAAEVRLRGEVPRFVSRGGDKLAGALHDLSIDVRGCYCLDIGASTGGFTDCLLQAGAQSVVAIDVGYGQLHLRLRADPRVHVLERTHVRDLRREDLTHPGEECGLAVPIDWVTIDVSFISLRRVLPRVVELVPAAQVLALVKPQFEVGKERVGRGGVVRDEADRAAAVAAVAACADELGYTVMSQAESRLPGPKGNREVFLHLCPLRRALVP